MKIRESIPADMSSLVALIDEYASTQEYRVRDIDFISGTETYHVAEVDGDLVGYIGGLPAKYLEDELLLGSIEDPNQTFFCEELFVRPDYRGQGIAKKLYHSLMEHALDEGYHGAAAVVAANNKAALGLHRSLGMDETPLDESILFRMLY